MATKARFSTAALVCAVLLAPAVHAQQTGELWEISSQMSMPGMPAGMVPAQTQQVCQSQAFDRTPGQDPSKCKISNMKQSANRISYSVRCEGKPPVTGSVDYSFEDNRSRMKGTMRMTSPDGDMTLQMSGRKLGTCDPVQQRAAQDKKIADAMQQGAAATQAADDAMIKQCVQSAERMEPNFGAVGRCTRGSDKECKGVMSSLSPRVKTACGERINAYCKSYATREGLLKIGREPYINESARMCGVPVQKVRAQLCPGAEKADALRFLALQCPAEAKVLAQKQCEGRAFTSSQMGRYLEFCGAYRGTLADGGGDGSRSAARPAAQPASAPAAEPEKPGLPDPGQAIQDGIGKIRGLFGR